MIFLAAISLMYSGILIFLLIGFFRVPEPGRSTSIPPHTFSIIIAFRNEVGHLPSLFETLKELNYPPQFFEIILVDDDSSDHSLLLCEKFKKMVPELSVRILSTFRSSQSPKKDAITTGLGFSQSEFILLTDADCQVPSDWLQQYNAYITQNNLDIIAGPVTIETQPKRNFLSFLQSFQSIDFSSLQMATIGGFGNYMPFLCNAANLCFRRQSFLDIQGYKGNDHIASGDDVYLLQKFLRNGYSAGYLKSTLATVTTTAQFSIKTLINQRIRWGSKLGGAFSLTGTVFATIVWLQNTAILLSGIIMAWRGNLETYFFILTGIKMTMDLVFVQFFVRFLKSEIPWQHYVLSLLCYPFFFTSIGLFSLYGTYSWKGRTYKK